jgi:hypothetical protein
LYLFSMYQLPICIPSFSFYKYTLDYSILYSIF